MSNKVNILNPLDKDLSIIFEGVTYSIGAGKIEQMDRAVAEYWKTYIHQFLGISEVGETPTAPEPAKDVPMVHKPLVVLEGKPAPKKVVK